VPPTDRSQADRAKARSRRPLVASWRRFAWFRWVDRHFSDVIVVTSALVAVLTGLVAFLQIRANNRYATSTRQGQTLAMEAMGQDMRSRQREGYDFSLYTTWNEWDWRRIRAGRTDDLALEGRASQVVEMIVPLTPLLDQSKPYYNTETDYSDLTAYHADINLFTNTLLLEQRAFVVQAASAWNNKADGYVTVLTLLAVSLFLYGLSTTIKENLRYLFALVGAFLVTVALSWTLVLTLSPVPGVPQQAVAEYARGQALAYKGKLEEARTAFDAALRAYRRYGNAYEARAGVLFDLGKYAEAVQDYESAVENGRADASTYWNLGWACYLAGDYPGSLRASRRALRMEPDLLPVAMNIATALLAHGQTDAAMQQYERGLLMAADPASEVPASWRHLYLRETVNDLERLINALGGQTGFYQVPDLSQVPDRAALLEAAKAARLRLKGGLVAIEATGSPSLEPAQARLSPLTFGRCLGQDGQLLGQVATFPRGVMAVAVGISYEDLPAGAMVSRRVTRLDSSGALEYLPTMADDITWNGPSAGTMYHEMKSPWPGDRGLLPGTYTVEYYVNGNSLQNGQFTVPEKTTPIVGPIVFALDSFVSGVPAGPAGIFPAGVAKMRGMFSYSGLSDERTRVEARWYRDGQLYSRDSSVLIDWGSEAFYLSDVPAGDYRLDLHMAGGEQVLQSATFRVLEVEQYLQAFGKEPEDTLFHRSLGDAYAYRGDYQEAVAHYQKAVELDPNCAKCYYRWWSALYDQEKYEEAIEKIRKAIELNPKEFTYLCNLGDTYYHAGEEENAVAAYREALPVAPADVFNLWGNSLYNQERFQESIVKYQQAIELKPDDAVFHSNLGGSYSELGQYDQAIAEFQQAVELDPGYALAYNQWGNALYAQERYAEAVEQYLHAVENDPNSATYYANLGGAYNELGLYELAIPEFEQAVALSPSYAWAYNKWGNALYGLGRYAEAVEKYGRAVELKPGVALYHYNLGLAYYQIQERDLARAEFEQAAELAAQIGDEQLRQQAEDMLKELE